MILERRTKNEERRTGGHPAAFTLIEVLVAMTVLSVLILMVANIFQSSSVAWNIGTQKADMNTAARAALDYMARELACAVAGPIEAVNPPVLPAISFQLIDGNEIKCVALSGDPASPSTRAFRGILFRYDFGSNIIKTCRNTESFNPYSQLPAWDGSARPVIENVLSMTMYAFANESDLNGGVGALNYNSNSLPLCLDIAVEMLSDDDMLRYNQTGVDKLSFRARNAKLYTTRIYFPNRKGYGGR